jgi:hypothetical protein
MKSFIFMLISVFVTTLLTGCNKDYELEMLRQEYAGNELRTDGYYEYKYYPSENNHSYAIFLYRNGVWMTVIGRDVNGVHDESEDRLTDEEFISHIKKTKTCWFIFQIKGKDITVQGWEHNTGNGRRILTRYGKILNNTTFELNREIIDNKSRVINQLYEFRKFSPKPDSTNNYIK